MSLSTTAAGSRWLTLAEGAELLGVHVKTLRRWVAAGYLPAHRVGPRSIRIRATDLEVCARQIPSAAASKATA